MDLLELPSADVLTTNWDTLLERACESAVDYSYEVVRTEADLTYAKSPRIVKLHGAVGDAGPLIFAKRIIAHILPNTSIRKFCPPGVHRE